MHKLGHCSIPEITPSEEEEMLRGIILLESTETGAKTIARAAEWSGKSQAVIRDILRGMREYLQKKLDA